MGIFEILDVYIIQQYTMSSSTIIHWEKEIPSDEELITIICYNLLANHHLYANKWLYKEIPDEQLVFSTRFEKLRQAFEDSRADFYMLQEVEASHLDQYRACFARELQHQLLFVKRPGGKPDGCAIAYNQERFQNLLEYYREIDYSQKCPLSGVSDNVGQIAVFREYERPDRLLLIANTHLVYSPNRGHIKLWQITSLLYEILKCKKRIQETEGEDVKISVILGGDLNSLPVSGLHRFLDGQAIDTEAESKKGFSNQKKGVFQSLASAIGDSRLPFQTRESNRQIIQHQVKLQPVYPVDDCSGKRSTFRYVVDHIFTENVEVLDRIQLIDRHSEHTLPGEEHGSDHTPIG